MLGSILRRGVALLLIGVEVENIFVDCLLRVVLEFFLLTTVLFDVGAPTDYLPCFIFLLGSEDATDLEDALVNVIFTGVEYFHQ